ncbi:DNA polymerase III subunit chi [Alteromonas gilva]|uniref:DNA polymerase III subunit chi n=1 Tax=Alteromonas gilva TaxID=2987522 RepID=A0ABT5L7V3_9ALTE|nr:DNA polymerase III subunit chi [Alteromonas gilva]MDC8832509.1 DNA polymerase III subunit chi [Alteromonas gilva]
MPAVSFYALTEASVTPEGLPSVPAVCAKACELTAELYAQKKKSVVLCVDQAQAEAIDELLWQLPAARFVPHNLTGEGPPGGAPVEIVWQQSALSRKQCLINLSGQMIDNPNQYQQVIDFVPVEEAAKQQARQRYKQFQQAGCQMQFLPA